MSQCHAIPLPPRGWTPQAMARFLDHLSVRGNVRAACARVGLSAEAAYRLRRRDALFARGWAAALVLARDSSEQVLATRAIDGVEQAVFHRGEEVGSRTLYDTRLLLAHLARLDRLVEEDERALEDAGRFDEVLALIAGERFPEELAGEDEALPMERAEVVGEAVADAQDRLLYAEGEPEGEDWSGEGDHAGAEAAHDAREEAVAAAGAAAGRAAQAQWDGWFARACAVVDGLVDGAAPPASPAPARSSPPPALPPSLEASAMIGAGRFDPGTVSTVSTSALAQALSNPTRGFPPQGHAASPARKQAGRGG